MDGKSAKLAHVRYGKGNKKDPHAAPDETTALRTVISKASAKAFDRALA